MVTGEKDEEFRRESKWILSRLNRKNKEELKLIKFTNGYRRDSPSFTVKYKGWEIAENVDKTYSNGLHVKGERFVCIKMDHS